MNFNILSFDVEYYFNTGGSGKRAFSIKEAKNRASFGLDRILELLNKKNIKATFFILGSLATEKKTLIKKISKQGHEIATHSFYHRFLQHQRPEEFKSDLEKSIKVLEDISGQKIYGFRAPGYSITPKTNWAIDIIESAGLQYDSSIYPVSVRMFTKGGFSGFPLKPFFIREKLFEFPLPTFNLLGVKLPIATTAYFRIIPYWFNVKAIKNLNQKNIPAVVNLHSWEFDPGQPRTKLRFPANFKHYYNLSKTRERFKKLLNNFNFVTCKKALELYLKDLKRR